MMAVYVRRKYDTFIVVVWKKGEDYPDKYRYELEVLVGESVTQKGWETDRNHRRRNAYVEFRDASADIMRQVRECIRALMWRYEHEELTMDQLYWDARQAVEPIYEKYRKKISEVQK